jgi:hypothetical protein
VTPEFFAQFGLSEIAKMSDFEMDQAGRITQPVILRPGAQHYEAISWSDAFAVN